MDIVGSALATAGIVFGLTALARVKNLEKKLKQFDVIPRDFDSGKETRDDEAE